MTTTKALARALVPAQLRNAERARALSEGLDDTWRALMRAEEELEVGVPRPQDYDGQQAHAEALAAHTVLLRDVRRVRQVVEHVGLAVEQRREALQGVTP